MPKHTHTVEEMDMVERDRIRDEQAFEMEMRSIEATEQVIAEEKAAWDDYEKEQAEIATAQIVTSGLSVNHDDRDYWI